LLHRVTLIPDERVIAAEARLPFGRDRVHAFHDDAVDIIVIHGPGIGLVLGCHLLAGRRRFERCRGRRLDVVHELELPAHVGMGPDAVDVAADQRLPGQRVDIGDLIEIAGDVLGQREAPPGHPAWKHHIDHHQHLLLWRVDEDVARLVRATRICQVEALAADLERVAVLEGHGRRRAPRILRPLEQPFGLFLGDDDRMSAEVVHAADMVGVGVAVDDMGDRPVGDLGDGLTDVR